jgi:hypothetical protein
LNLGNLVLWARSELNGFAGKDSALFWSTGVLEYRKKLKPEFQLEYVLIITPSLLGPDLARQIEYLTWNFARKLRFADIQLRRARAGHHSITPADFRMKERP